MDRHCWTGPRTRAKSLWQVPLSRMEYTGPRRWRLSLCNKGHRESDGAGEGEGEKRSREVGSW